jgi:hypothetical protein
MVRKGSGEVLPTLVVQGLQKSLNRPPKNTEQQIAVSKNTTEKPEKTQNRGYIINFVQVMLN